MTHPSERLPTPMPEQPEAQNPPVEAMLRPARANQLNNTRHEAASNAPAEAHQGDAVPLAVDAERTATSEFHATLFELHCQLAQQLRLTAIGDVDKKAIADAKKMLEEEGKDDNRTKEILRLQAIADGEQYKANAEQSTANQVAPMMNFAAVQQMDKNALADAKKFIEEERMDDNRTKEIWRLQSTAHAEQCTAHKVAVMTLASIHEKEKARHAKRRQLYDMEFPTTGVRAAPPSSPTSGWQEPTAELTAIQAQLERAIEAEVTKRLVQVLQPHWTMDERQEHKALLAKLKKERLDLEALFDKHRDTIAEHARAQDYTTKVIERNIEVLHKQVVAQATLSEALRKQDAAQANLREALREQDVAQDRTMGVLETMSNTFDKLRDNQTAAHTAELNFFLRGRSLIPPPPAAPHPPAAAAAASPKASHVVPGGPAAAVSFGAKAPPAMAHGSNPNPTAPTDAPTAPAAGFAFGTSPANAKTAPVMSPAPAAFGSSTTTTSAAGFPVGTPAPTTAATPATGSPMDISTTFQFNIGSGPAKAKRRRRRPTGHERMAQFQAGKGREEKKPGSSC